MELEVQSIWADGEPEHGQEEFDVQVNVSIGEVGGRGGEVFQFRVMSPLALAKVESGRFVTHTLILESYSVETIRIRLEKLLHHVSSSKNWNDVIHGFSGLLRHEP